MKLTDQLFSPCKKSWPWRSEAWQHDRERVPDRTGGGPAALSAVWEKASKGETKAEPNVWRRDNCPNT